MVAGAPVELGGQFAGGGEHDRVTAVRAVVEPGVEDVLGEGVEVADVDPAVVEVEAEGLRAAVAQGEGGGGFGGVGEPEQLGQAGGAVGGGEVAQHAAGADRGELLVVSDQPDAAAPGHDEVDGGVEGEGVGHAGLVEENQGGRPDPLRPVGQVAGLDGPDELGEGVGAGVGLGAQHLGRGGGRGEPDHVAAALDPRRGQGTHGGGLARPGGGDGQLQPRPGGGEVPDQRGLPGVERGAVRSGLQQRQLDRRGRGGVPVPAAGGGDQPPLGGEHPGGGELVGADHGVDRGSVATAQRWRLGDAVRGPGQRHRPHRQGLVDQQTDHGLDLVRAQVRGADLAQGLGVHVPHLPGRPSGFNRGHDPASRGGQPGGVHHGAARLARAMGGRGGKGGADHRGDLPRPAEDLGGLLAPRRALLGEAARLVLGVPRFQGRLLGELDGLDRGRWPAVGALKLGGQLAAAGLNAGPPGGPPLVQPGVDADDFPHRTFARVGARPLREPDAELGVQVPLEGGVVGLRRRDASLEQGPTVDAQPFPAPPIGPAPSEGLHLVGDRDVGVQVGVAGPAVAVGERRGDQPGDLDLPHPAVSLPGEQRTGLEEPQRVGDRRLVGCLHPGCYLGWCDGPQRADRLDRGEGQVVPGDCGGLRAGVLGDGRGDLAGAFGVAAVLGAEQLDRDFGADPGPVRGRDGPVTGQPGRLVHRGDPLRDLDPEPGHVARVDAVRSAEPGHRPVVRVGQPGAVQGVPALLGERVVTGPEQGLHLLGGDHVAGRQPVDAGQPGADPAAGCLALGGVVVGEAGVAFLGRVQRRDLPGQVVIPRPGGQLVQRHRHT